MTVAVAMMGLQAMAMAPVIGEIPSPIVGDGVGATTPNVFVYPDAFNLANYVTDDNTTPSSILWSYWISGTPIYRINNIAPLDPGSEDPVTPGAKTINTQVGAGETNPDGNPATLTIRNVHLSPVGAAAGGEPGPTGKLNSETQLVTFFASDGTTYSSKTVAFYTYNNFDDQLTPVQSTQVAHYPFTGVSQGFSFTSFNFHGTISGVYYGGTLTNSVDANGICFSVSTDGNNAAQYASPWGIIPLVKNAVYHIRMKMNGSQTTVGHTPFWDVNVSNYLDQTGKTPAWRGLDAYGCDSWYLDNRGGANAVIAKAAPGTSFHVWFTPSAVATTSWNADNGIFNASVGAERDAYVFWRVMDVDSTSGITASLDSGSLCMTDMAIERFDLGSMQFVSNDYAPSLTQGIVYNANGTTTDAGGTMGAHGFYTNSTFTFTNGTIICQPNPDATAVSNGDLITVFPKDGFTGHFDNDPLVPACYPVTWKDDTLYQVTMDLSAPNANSQTNPCDVFFIGADVPTNELIYDSYTCAAKNVCGMPKTTVQTYMAFFWSHKATVDTNTNNKRIRPRFQMGNNAGLQFTMDATPGTIIPSQGGITINSIKINEVKFPGAIQ